jgi:hypothetical protein
VQTRLGSVRHGLDESVGYEVKKKIMITSNKSNLILPLPTRSPHSSRFSLALFTLILFTLYTLYTLHKEGEEVRGVRRWERVMRESDEREREWWERESDERMWWESNEKEMKKSNKKEEEGEESEKRRRGIRFLF